MLILLVCFLSAVDSLTAVDDAAKLSKAQLQFSTELFQTIAAKDLHKDVSFSPYSIYSSLLTLYLASTGSMEKVIEHVVRFDKYSKPDENYISHNFFHEVPEDVPKEYELISYDRIYINPTFYVQAGLELKRKAVSETKNELEDDINNWVSLYTKGMIKTLFEKGSIKKDEAFVIVNAAYVKGYWAVPLTGGTSKKSFTLSDGTGTETLFMSVKDKPFQSMTDQELKAQIISLPYEGDDISMIVILPTTKPQKKAPPPLADVVKKLNLKMFLKIEFALKSQKMRTTDLMIPKFESEGKYDLKPILEALGDKELFSQKFSLPIYFGKEQTMKISRIFHIAKVNAHENGTEAAAASATVGTKSLSSSHPTTTFHADHPFAYIIYDQNKLFIHYMGILNKPKKQK